VVLTEIQVLPDQLEQQAHRVPQGLLEHKEPLALKVILGILAHKGLV
jgi:hypothetical protein